MSRNALSADRPATRQAVSVGGWGVKTQEPISVQYCILWIQDLIFVWRLKILQKLFLQDISNIIWFKSISRARFSFSSCSVQLSKKMATNFYAYFVPRKKTHTTANRFTGLHCSGPAMICIILRRGARVSASPPHRRSVAGGAAAARRCRRAPRVPRGGRPLSVEALVPLEGTRGPSRRRRGEAGRPPARGPAGETRDDRAPLLLRFAACRRLAARAP